MSGQATPVGTDVVTSISRRYIMPEIVDNIYRSNPVFYRINQSGKRIIRGGYQIEVPLMYQELGTGGPYEGYQLLDVAPSDTIKNGAWNWRQQYVNVTVDGLTLIKTDSPEAVANFLQLYFAQAEMQMCKNLGVGIWSSGTNPIQIDGLGLAVDDGGVADVYGGLSTSANAFWSAVDNSASATLTLAVMQTLWGNTQYGGRHTTLIASRQEQYNRYWALGAGETGGQRFPVGPGGHDEQLMSAGFTNIMFNNAPWIVDSNVPDGPNSTNSGIYFLDEDYIWLAVSPRADFYMEDFQTPVNQDAMVAKILWAGNLVVTNRRAQGKLSAITG